MNPLIYGSYTFQIFLVRYFSISSPKESFALSFVCSFVSCSVSTVFLTVCVSCLVSTVFLSVCFVTSRGVFFATFCSEAGDRDGAFRVGLFLKAACAAIMGDDMFVIDVTIESNLSGAVLSINICFSSSAPSSCKCFDSSSTLSLFLCFWIFSSASSVATRSVKSSATARYFDMIDSHLCAVASVSVCICLFKFSSMARSPSFWIMSFSLRAI